MERCWCRNKNLTIYSNAYNKCEKCNTLISAYSIEDSIYSTENEETDLYGKNYWEVSMTKAAGKNNLSEVVDMYLTERVIYWLKYVLKYVKLGAEVAEIGCGLGQLQYVLKKLGYQQLAFELSGEICHYMEANLGIDTHCGPFEENTRQYDAILSFDLFEHLLQPKVFVDKCNTSLREGGVLCMQTPCYNPDWDYESMLQKGAKFEEQLKEEQHVFLYSKEALSQLLKEKGYTFIKFEPAFFGDDYDMFLFASKEPFVENTEKEIEEYLNAQPNGRLIKAMIALFDERKVLRDKYKNADEDRKARQEQIEILSKRLQESEADRGARQKQIEILTKMLQESEEDREARMKQIETLTKLLQESEEDRAARLEQIETLTAMISEIQKKMGCSE